MRSQENALYQRALKFLYRRTNYETFKSIPYDQMANSLRRLREFLEYLHHPERRYVVIHVAGTKGKGTVCGALDRIYRAQGYRVGLFTSPHLDDLTERVLIDGKKCDKTFFAETLLGLVDRWKEFLAEKKKDVERDEEFDDSESGADDRMTFFEWTFILAVALFARAGVDVAILEVGMGGRFDATNACDADLSILTSVSYDHCEQLGNALREIAAEKLAIVKTNAPLVSGVGFASRLYHEPVVKEPEPEESGDGDADSERVSEKKESGAKTEKDWRLEEQALLAIEPQTLVSEQDIEEVKELARKRAEEFGAPFYQVEELSPFVEDLPIPPFDSVRKWNFEIALRAVETLAERNAYPQGRQNDKGRSGKLSLPVDEQAIAKAAENFALPARMEIVSTNPLILVDGAHNRASVAATLLALKERYPNRKIRILFASTVGKDVRGMIAEIAPVADEVVLTERSKDERAVPIAELIQTAEETLDEACSEDAPIRRKFRVVPDFRAFLADYCTRPTPNKDVLCAIGSFYFAAEVRKEVRAR